MSSAGQIVGGVVGGVVGWFTTYTPQGVLYGAQIGAGVGAAIDPPKGPNIIGPRLTDLGLQTSTYGAAVPRIYGKVAVHGNIFYLENNKLRETAKKKKQGGKGGGGGTSVTTYSYSATFAVGLCEGPIDGIGRVWIGPKLVYNPASPDINQAIASNIFGGTMRIYTGSDTQQPDPIMQQKLGVNNTPAYRGLAYLMFHDLPLRDFGNTLMGAQIKAEVIVNNPAG